MNLCPRPIVQRFRVALDTSKIILTCGHVLHVPSLTPGSEGDIVFCRECQEADAGAKTKR